MRQWRRLRDRVRGSKVNTVDPLTGYNRWAKTYASEDNPVLELDTCVLERLLPDVHGKCVLDVGCGTGRVTRMLAERDPAHITAVDFSVNMLYQAREQLRAAPRTELVAAQALALPFTDESFDLVTCSLMISHVEDLQSFVTELARVARPGGHLLISDLHPFGHLLGWNRSFVEQRNGGVERIGIHYYRHLHEEYFRAFRTEHLEIEELREPRIDESVKHFFEGSRGGLTNYQRIYGYPVVLFFRLRA